MTWFRMCERTFVEGGFERLGGLAALALCTLAFSGGSLLGQSGEQLRLSLGQSVVVNYPEDIRQIHTTDDKIADVNVVSTREMLVLAKGVGSTDIVVWSASNQPMYYNVTVGLNVEGLRRLLRETFPGETIDIRTAGDSISLNGMVSRQEVADRAAVLAGVVAKSVVNNLKLAVAPIEKQVLLRVRFAELDRQKATDLGIDLSSGAFNMASASTLGAANPFTLRAIRSDIDLNVVIRALENRSILQILSEPNLVTSNKKEASFLVGGEFPILVPQGGASNAVTIQYREFGIRLKFTPEITQNDTIKLTLSQEVSSIDQTLAVAFNGFSVPGLTTRRAETFVELADGQSFVVAGLMDNQTKEQFQKIPFIGDIPILGTLFKSKSDSKTNRELIMLVTPQLTVPMSAAEPTPEVDFPVDFLKKDEVTGSGGKLPIGKTNTGKAQVIKK
jgi:pilus assembly protein CpaC